MKRLWRITIRTTALLSFALAIACLVIYVRSFDRGHRFTFTSQPQDSIELRKWLLTHQRERFTSRSCEVTLVAGNLFVRASQQELMNQQAELSRVPPREVFRFVKHEELTDVDRAWQRASWSIASTTLGVGMSDRVQHGLGLGTIRSTTLVLPLLWPIALFACGSMIVLPGAWRGWRTIQRQWRGCCPTCGYDLRAASTHCPECGRVREHAPNPAAIERLQQFRRAACLCLWLTAALLGWLYASHWLMRWQYTARDENGHVKVTNAWAWELLAVGVALFMGISVLGLRGRLPGLKDRARAPESPPDN